MIITDIQILSILLFEKPPKNSEGTNWKERGGKEEGGATNEQENKEAAVSHSSLLLEKIPQEREIPE